MIRADTPICEQLQALVYRLVTAPNGIAEALANEEGRSISSRLSLATSA